MQLKLYQQKSKKKEVFSPIVQEEVKLYVCGPTVYSTAHIGNARPAVVFDCLTRVLRGVFPKVTYVRNITDVDDKINAAAAKEGVGIDVIARRYTEYFHQDLHALGCLPPDIEPKATDHMAEMIHMITTLIEKKHAYESAGHVLFSVPSYQHYGVVSGRDQTARQAGARVAVESYKQHGEDFILWKPSLDSEPGWDSPWGRGRPGWHIECSAMIEKHLGLPIDIHGGGGDLLFPHHENENAQGCCYHSREAYVNYWMHNGMVKVDDEKMSKSIGNILLVRDLLAHHQGEVVRLALLQTHYRQPLLWHSVESIASAKLLLDKAYRVLEKISNYQSIKWQYADIPEEVQAALLDDLNTPLAIMHWQRLCKRLWGQATITEQEARSLMATHHVLGVGSQDVASWFHGAVGQEHITPQEIESKIKARQQARAERDFVRADEIRAELQDRGVVIEDLGGDTTWRYR